MPRVLVIGLDSVPPVLAFERYRAAMPNLASAMARGCYGPLRSTTPPITVPAWACLLSGYDPGELGLYGFRQRRHGSYELQLASSRDVQRPMIWDRLRSDQRACVLFVPPSYPPRPVHGQLASCLLTPDSESPWSYPDTLRAELTERFGAYQPDIEDYRSDDLPRVLAEVYAGSRQRFAMAEHLLARERPDLMVVVDIGPDRFHHAFWPHIDPDDPKHVPDNPYARAGLDYYRFLDEQIGRMLRAAGPETAVIVMSDHGVRPLRGTVHVNQWLIERGYLVLKRYPDVLTPFAELDVDWGRTRAFAEGGYYARVMLNVVGREPAGIVPERAVAELSAELAGVLHALPGPSGERVGARVTRSELGMERTAATRVLRPADCYRETRGLPPDLMVFLGDLAYRASAAIGGDQLYSAGNDQGPDGCNHAWDGIFALAGPGVEARGARTRIHHTDVAVTILSLLGVPALDLRGTDVRGAA
jgi:predicted AlkP superfamily phosphohydrolase/phosphomutase